MSEKKPIPLAPAPKRKVCPICGHSTYSPGGIHPQCAIAQADAPRKARLAAARKAIKDQPDDTETVDCPNCHAELPNDSKSCACGYALDRN